MQGKKAFDLDAVCCILTHRSSALWEESPMCSNWYSEVSEESRLGLQDCTKVSLGHYRVAKVI